MFAELLLSADTEQVVRRANGPPWFAQYTVPLALILVLLSGVGPVIAWRRATLANARRNFVLPLAAAAAMAIAAYTFVPIGSSRRPEQEVGGCRGSSGPCFRIR